MEQARILTVIYPQRRSLPESHITASFTPMGGNLYRQDEGFLCLPVYFGDIFEADPTDQEGVMIFRRRVKKGGQKLSTYLIPHDLVEKPGFFELGRKIREFGGFSAVDFKGLFVVFLPKSCDFDIGTELDKVAGISKWKRHYRKWKWSMKQRLKKANEWLLSLR
jgi:hypothetical protein